MKQQHFSVQNPLAEVLVLTFHPDNLRWLSCWGPHPCRGIEQYLHKCSSAIHSL